MRPMILLYALLHLIFVVPSFASIQIRSSMPRAEAWESLSEKEKNLAYHLHRASKFSADILYFQNHRHALSIKYFLESVLSQNNLRLLRHFYGSSEKGKERFQEFLAYSAKFFSQSGPYNASKEKILLRNTRFKEIKSLFKKFVPKSNRYPIDEIAKMMTDEEFEPKQRILNANESMVFSTRSRHPVGPCLEKVVQELNAAAPYALTDTQEKQIKDLVQSLQAGTPSTETAADLDSKIIFSMGFSNAKWNSCVQVKGLEYAWGTMGTSACVQNTTASASVTASELSLDQPWTINADLELLVRGNTSLEGSASYWTE